MSHDWLLFVIVEVLNESILYWIIDFPVFVELGND